VDMRIYMVQGARGGPEAARSWSRRTHGGSRAAPGWVAGAGAA
jgi:hypothetical protein